MLLLLDGRRRGGVTAIAFLGSQAGLLERRRLCEYSELRLASLAGAAEERCASSEGDGVSTPRPPSGGRERGWPSLVTEADTVEQLVTKLRTMVPELLEANGVLGTDVEDVPIRLTAGTCGSDPAPPQRGLNGGLRGQTRETAERGGMSVRAAR